MTLLFIFLQIIIVVMAGNCGNQTLFFSDGLINNVTTNINISWFSEDDYWTKNESDAIVNCRTIYLNMDLTNGTDNVIVFINNSATTQYESCYNICNIEINCDNIDNVLFTFVVNNNEVIFTYNISSIYRVCGDNSNNNVEDNIVATIIIIVIIGSFFAIFFLLFIYKFIKVHMLVKS